MRGPGLGTTAICDSSSRESDTFFWPPEALHKRGAHTYTYTHINGCVCFKSHKEDNTCYLRIPKKNQAWWYTPVIPELRSLRQADFCEFKANLYYTGLSELHNRETLSQNMQNNRKKSRDGWIDSLVGKVLTVCMHEDLRLTPRPHVKRSGTVICL